MNGLAELRHNLRTPVNHILGYSEMMIEDLEEQGQLDGCEQLRSLHAAGKQILTLINTALSPAQTEIDTSALSALREQLTVPLSEILAANQALQENLPRPDLAEDLRKIRAAAEQLLALSGDMVEPTPTAVAPLSSVEVPDSAQLLLVDDNAGNRDMLSRRLQRQGYTTATAENGRQALDLLRKHSFDLVLLDIMMPELDGFGVLGEMKADAALRGIPVIMLSALDDVSSVVRCLEMGAEDYLSKPFDPVLLRARIGACLERKRLRDHERLLLLNILPADVADELRSNGTVEPKYFEDVTIAFADFTGFTLSTEQLSAEELVHSLHRYFTAFDRIMDRYGLEKLKTIGDCYMFAGGLPARSPSHPVDVVMAASELIQAAAALRTEEAGWQVRIGIHTGPVIAGVVGIKKFAFDIWGDTVNYSARMESCGAPDRINLSERTHSRIKDFFDCERRGKVLTKEGKEFEMFFVKGLLPKLRGEANHLPPAPFLRRYHIYFQKSPPAFPEFWMGSDSS